MPSIALTRAALIAAALLALTACGRRGPLEPPPDLSAPKAQPTAQSGQNVTVDEDEEASQGLTPSLSTQPKKRARGYTIPNKPFLLDPLL